MSAFFQVQSFFSYWLNAVNEHSLHSPFYYDLYTNTIRPDTRPASAGKIEARRKELRQDTRTIQVHDLGRGAAYTTQTTSRICDIARTSLTPAKFSRLYQRLINALGASEIVELGTSLGINTLYLANAGNTRIHTFEGADAIAAIARNTFHKACTENITLIEGNINTTLPACLANLHKADFVYMDANHRYTPTMQYFSLLLPYLHAKSVLILDDIHTSPGMTRAWQHIQQHPLVYGSLDLYRCGIAFFDPSLHRQHAVLQF